MYKYNRSFIEFDRSVLTALMSTVTKSPQKATQELLNHFPSFQHVTRADFEILSEIVGETGAKLLKTIPEAVASMTRETMIDAASYILAMETAVVHFSALLNGRRNETLAVLYLNAHNRLIAEDVWEGTIDRTSIYPREIMRRVILTDALTVIIAHNHPSGETDPSPEDLKVTSNLDSALNSIGVILLDHIIFGEGEPYSMRANCDI